MGFYGNITNTSRTQFQFQRVYANRYLMDNSAATDGVYMGNYVLVDYDTELQADWCITAYAYTKPTQYIQCATNAIFSSDTIYYEEIDGEYVAADITAATFNENKSHYYTRVESFIELYTGPKDDGGSRITYSQCRIPKSVYSTASADAYYTKYILVPANKTVNGSTIIYNHIGDTYTTSSPTWTGSTVDTVFRVIGWTGNTQDFGYPVLEAITAENSAYGKNFAIDQQYYNNPRGYDSTVWQKVYTGTPPTAHYVMLAELNTVVPTFIVSADAPTVNPAVPHFDTSSTNVLYNLHMQPSWGLRVKSAANTYVAADIDGYSGYSHGSLVRMNFDNVSNDGPLPSDETTNWSIPYLDDANNEMQLYTYFWKDSALNGSRINGQWGVGRLPGYTEDIPAAIYYNKAGFDSSISTHYTDSKDTIQLTPTGLSGQKYHIHSSKYELVGVFGSETGFNTYVNNLWLEIQENYPNDRLYDTAQRDSGDMYHRDILYKRINGVYVGVSSFSATDKDSTSFYRKTTLPIVGETEAQVDTQELSIMLPSIGNSIASMWDLIYGDENINKSVYRNKKIDWLDGRVFHNDDGLRLVTVDDSGYGYQPGAAETLAGTINTGHDLIGMMIKKRPDNVLLRAKRDGDPESYYVESDTTIRGLSSSYIYYYPAEGRYYRRGIEYEWDSVNYTTYSAITTTVDPTTNETIQTPTRLTEEFLSPIAEGKLASWPSPNENLYYREVAAEIYKTVENDDPEADTEYVDVLWKRYFNFILEQDYYHGREYVTFHKTKVTASDTYNADLDYYEMDGLGNFYTYTYDANTWNTLITQEKLYVSKYPVGSHLVEIGEEGFTKFEKYKYYNYDPAKKLSYTTTNSEGQEVIKEVAIPTIYPTEDEEYDQNKLYYSINSAIPIGDNYRFFEYNPDDITAQFYVVPANGWAQRTVTSDEYEEAPTRYYIKNGDSYERSAGYDSSATYYIPLTFELVDTFDPTVDVYYTVEVTRTKENEVYVIQVSYEPYAAGKITDAEDFSDYVCYVKDEDKYILATKYVAGTTYYRRREKWILTSVPEQITADNATQVKCLDPSALMMDQYVEGGYRPLYYYRNPVGASGLEEYYGITAVRKNGKLTLTCKLNYEIVNVSWTNKIGFYAPNTMYYRVESGPFKGSWMLDTNKNPTEDRQYYYPMENSDFYGLVDEDEVPIAFYEGNTYSDETGNLNSSTIYDPETEKYYTYSPLYVYSIADNSPAKDKFQVGDRWNMDVDLTADMGLTLRKLVEKPSMIPLNGYARSSQTMNGSILRVDEILSNNDIYTRSRKTIMGTINYMNDIITMFKSIKANEPILSDRYGHLYSRGMVFNNVGDTNVIAHSATDNADPWVHITEDRATDQDNWHIQVHHKLLNDATGTLQPITHTDLVLSNKAENAQAQTPLFGQTFKVLNRVKKDAAGHIHSITTDTVTIPLPSLAVDSNLNSSNDYLVIMDIALDDTNGALTYRKQNVATLKLHDYSNSTAANYPTTGHIIADTQTINGAFAAIETYIANSDLATQFADTGSTNNEYITNLTQTDGRISYSVTSLLNTNATITTTANGAVSGKGVRDVINALDVSTQFTGHEHEDNYYITELTETDGKIAYSLTQLLNTNAAITNNAYGAVSGVGVRAVIDALDSSQAVEDTGTAAAYMTGITEENGKLTGYTQTTFITSVTNETNSIVAPTGAAVATYVNGLFTNTAYTNKASTSKWITSLNQTYGEIDYEVTDLLTSVADIYGANAGYAASGTAIRNGIDDVFLSLPAAEEGNFLTSLYYEYASNEVQHYRLKGSSTAFKTDILANNESLVAPTTKAVYDYLNTAYAGTTYVTTLGTIATGAWQGTTIAVGYGGTGTNVAPTAYGVIYAASATGYASTAAGASGQYLMSNGNAAPSWETFSASTVGLGNVTNDAQVTLDTFSGAYQLLYSTDASEVAVLSPNTTTTKMFLSMTGDGTDGTAPVWAALAESDIPTLSASKIGSGVFEYVQWAGAALNTIPHTVTTNGETTVSYPAINTINSALEAGDTTTIVGTDTIITSIQKLKLRIDDLETYIGEIFTANPTLTDPRASVTP